MYRMIAAALAGAVLMSAGAQAEQAPEPAQDLAAPGGAHAEASRSRIGYGRLFTNDFLGDGRDRWRTGSVSSSRVWGYGWDGTAPAAFGDLLELRLMGQIIAPADLAAPDAGDRPWAGALSAGLHSHVQRGNAEYVLGADLVMTGPQTRLDDFQDWLHDLLSAPQASDSVLASQIPDKFQPGLVAEAGRTLALGDGAALRPFAEARAGDETLLRAGADLTFGGAGRDALWVRDPVTGQRYRSVEGTAQGLNFVLGGDMAYVADSIYLPESRGYELTSRRDRVRAGLFWQGDGASAFYGLTYLGREFESQPEGQLTGSVRLNLRF